jgi:hypothetical protein
MVFLTEVLISRTIYEQFRLTTMVNNSYKGFCPMVRETVHYGSFFLIILDFVFLFFLFEFPRFFVWISPIDRIE